MTKDGRVIPLLWTCHKMEHAKGTLPKFACHVLEKTLVALSPEYEYLLQ